MDVHEFDSMSKEDQMEYFWECSERVDSYRGNSHDYFLHRDKEHHDFYMELSLHRNTDEIRINGMSHSEMYIKYRLPHEGVDKLPWE